MAVVLARPATILPLLFLEREGWSEEACQARRAAGFVIQGRERDAKYLPRDIAAMSSIATIPNAALVCADTIAKKKRESSCELSRADVIDG
jgi:hypothetical protein